MPVAIPAPQIQTAVDFQGPLTTGYVVTWSGTLNKFIVSAAGVSGGGTGVTSFTAYAVLCGGTTSTNPLQNVSGLGTSGQVLTSAGAGALPTWEDVGGGTPSNLKPQVWFNYT